MSWKLYKPGQGYWTRVLTGVGGGVLIAAGIVWLIEQLSVIQGDWRMIAQLIAVLIVAGVFGPLVYRAAAASPRTGDFLIATEGEMKKVNWPARKEVTGSTWVVIWTVVLLTILLYTSDFLFTVFFRSIGILETAA